MMMFNYPPIVLALLSLWIIVLGVIYISFIISTFKVKKYVLFSISIGVASSLIFFNQVFAMIISNDSSAFTLWFAGVHIGAYILVLSVFTLLVPIFIIFLVKYNQTHITSNSIIEAFNTSKEGFLYFGKDGTCLLVNKKMEEIGLSLTKKYILNGYDFLNIVKDKTIALPSGGAYVFINREVNIETKPFLRKKTSSRMVNELIALDVTELVKQNNQLELDNNKLKKLNEDLVNYNKTMLEVIRHREILDAKINIHNEMNELVLQSSYLLTNDDKKEKEKVLSKWENNAILLFKEAEHTNEDYIHNLSVLADTVGITIEYDNHDVILKDEKIINLFITAAKESLMNVAKHTNSKKIIINVESNDDSIVMSFINKDNKNTKPIKMGGGLSSLEKRVNECSGKMTIVNKDEFILKIEVPNGL